MVRQTIVVAVAENGVSPVKLDKEPIVLNVVLKDALVIAYHQVVDSFFGITCGINGPKVCFKF